MTNPREKESSGEGRALQLPLRRLEVFKSI